MKKIETSALIGLGALGILFGRKMPGVKVIADAERVARYSAQPVVCNGKECHFDYVTPEQGPTPSSSACSTASQVRTTSRLSIPAAVCGASPSGWTLPGWAAA